MSHLCASVPHLWLTFADLNAQLNTRDAAARRSPAARAEEAGRATSTGSNPRTTSVPVARNRRARNRADTAAQGDQPHHAEDDRQGAHRVERRADDEQGGRADGLEPGEEGAI